MTIDNKQIIEINGIKMEVDMRTAKRIDQFRVGDPVKLLINTSSDAEVMAGVIVDFENFSTLPTIVVAYCSSSYWSAELKFAHINSKTKDKYEIVASSEDTLLALDKATVLNRIQTEIEKKENEISELKQKREYFIKRFGIYFGESAEVEA